MSIVRILVTGVNGFFGRYLSKYLIENYPASEIIGTDLNELQSPLPLKCIISDITDYYNVKKMIVKTRPNIIFHLAGTFNQKDLLHLYSVNVIGTENLMKAAISLHNNTRIILSSSAAVYGFVAPKNNPVNENTEVKPVSHYGISKATMEMTGRMYGQDQKNLEIIIARIFNLIGNGISSSLLPGSLTEKIHEALKVKGKKKIKVGNINSFRDFLDVRDAVNAYILLALKGINNNIYNIGSGIGTKIKDIIELFVKNVGSEIQIISDNKLYKKNDPEIITADITKIKNHTGWKPRITLEESVLDIIKHKFV